MIEDVFLAKKKMQSRISTVAGNKTLVLSDVGKLLKITAASIITIPPNADVAFGLGVEISVISYTADEVSIAPGTGVTLYSKDGYRKIDGQYSAGTLKKMGTNEWVLIGALKG